MKQHLDQALFDHPCVTEEVSEQGKGKGQSMPDKAGIGRPHHAAGAARFSASLRFGIGLLHLSLMLLTGSAVLLTQPASAVGIIVDKSAPEQEQATLHQTANGLPQINIRTAAAGNAGGS